MKTIPAQKQLEINTTRPEPSFFGTNRDWLGTRPCSQNTFSTLSASQRKLYSKENTKYAKLHSFSHRPTGKTVESFFFFTEREGEQVLSMCSNERCGLSGKA